MTEIETDGLISPQIGLINIGELLGLHLDLRSSTEKKLEKIFELLKRQRIQSDRFYDFLIAVIESCTCEEYTHIRIPFVDRTVMKTTHTKR
jgi:hypothetical protein